MTSRHSQSRLLTRCCKVFRAKHNIYTTPLYSIPRRNTILLRVHRSATCRKEDCVPKVQAAVLKVNRCAHQSSDRNHMTSQHLKSRLLTFCCKVFYGEIQYLHYSVVKYFKVKYNIAESALVCNLQKRRLWVQSPGC